MSRRAVGSRWNLLALIALVGLVAGPVPGWAAEDPRTVRRFLQELKDHGFHDLALEYLNQLRADPTLPADFKAVLDYEEGRTLIDEAIRTGDAVMAEEFLKEARAKLDGFVKAHPQRPEARDAMVQLAKLLVERGYQARVQSEETQDKGKKEAKLADARAAYVEAHAAYAKAVEVLDADRKKYPVSLPDGDPRRAERDDVYNRCLDAMLQKGVSEYELAQTYPAGSPERSRYLKSALEQFDGLHKNHREQFAGLAAQMWQAKCFEEQGDVGAAIGLYKQLLEHTDPRLRALQRHVGYFHLVALAKRKEYALAADEASRWLQKYSRREERHSREGMGVLVEMAKAIDAQMPEIATAERPRAVRQIVEALNQVVRYASPYKNEALALLKKYKPSAAIRAEEIARLSFEEVMNRAEEAIAAREWDRAIALFKAAAKKPDLVREAEKVNSARYNLAFCYYMTKQYYEADVLAEHIARRYPQSSLAPRATTIGMQALADAYNTYTGIDRLSDIERLVQFATYTAETWPDREEGDDARFNLGLIYTGRGQYDQAIAVLSAIRRRSKTWFEGQTKLGAAHWAKSRLLERRGETAAASAEAQTAIAILGGTLKARQQAGVPQSDPGLVGNVGDLAIVLTETGKPAEALALLAPVIKAQTVRAGPAYARLMEAQLTAQITSNQAQQAIATMKTLEQAGGRSNLTQLYLKLGRLLQRELDARRQRSTTTAFTQLQAAYKTFLTTLAGSKTGQTYESLEWAGESLLDLEAYQEAADVFQRVLKEFTQDSQFLQQPDARNHLLRTRLKLAAALRGQGELDQADQLISDLLKEYPRDIRPHFEKGMLLEAEAQARRSDWSAALRHWETLARQAERMRPRTRTYYEIWYHVAWVLAQQKQTLKARQTLQGVMRLAPSVGDPEMKAKYQGLLARLSQK